jgi:hypothetical protein
MAIRTRINTTSEMKNNLIKTEILYDDLSNNRENRLPIVAAEARWTPCSARWKRRLRWPRRTQASRPTSASISASVEAQHGPFWWIGRIGQGDQHLHCG